MSKKEMYQAAIKRINWLDTIRYDIEKGSSENRESSLEYINVLRTSLMVSVYRINEPDYGGEIQYIVDSINNAGVFINRYRGIEAPSEEIVVNAPAEEKEDPDNDTRKGSNEPDNTEEVGRSYSDLVDFNDELPEETALIPNVVNLPSRPTIKNLNMAGERYDDFDSF